MVLVVNNSLTTLTLSFGSLDGTLLWMLAAFAWALYVDRGAPYNLRLGALRVMAWTTLIGSLVLLPISLVFDSLGGVRPTRRPSAGLLALHRDLPRGRGLSRHHAPASTGWG